MWFKHQVNHLKKPHHRLVLGCILSVAFVLRIIILLIYFPEFRFDPGVYAGFANVLIWGHRIKDHYLLMWPAGYPGLLAFLSWLVGSQKVPFLIISGLNVFLNMLEIILIYRIVCLLTLNRRLGLIGAALAALNPAFLGYTSYSYTEIACSCLATLLLFLQLLSLKNIRYLGLVIPLAIVAYHYNARLIGLVVLCPLILLCHYGWKQALSGLCGLMIMFFVLGYPRAAMVHQNEKQWCFGSMVGGLNLWLGNNLAATGNISLIARIQPGRSSLSIVMRSLIHPPESCIKGLSRLLRTIRGACCDSYHFGWGIYW